MTAFGKGAGLDRCFAAQRAAVWHSRRRRSPAGGSRLLLFRVEANALPRADPPCCLPFGAASVQPGAFTLPRKEDDEHHHEHTPSAQQQVEEEQARVAGGEGGAQIVEGMHPNGGEQSRHR